MVRLSNLDPDDELVEDEGLFSVLSDMYGWAPEGAVMASTIPDDVWEAWEARQLADDDEKEASST